MFSFELVYSMMELYWQKKFTSEVCHNSYWIKQDKKLFRMNNRYESIALNVIYALKLNDRKSNLVKYFRIHTKKIPLIVKFVKKKFAHKNFLIWYQATHNNLKTYDCQFCNIK